MLNRGNVTSDATQRLCSPLISELKLGISGDQLIVCALLYAICSGRLLQCYNHPDKQQIAIHGSSPPERNNQRQQTVLHKARLATLRRLPTYRAAECCSRQQLPRSSLLLQLHLRGAGRAQRQMAARQQYHACLVAQTHFARPLVPLLLASLALLDELILELLDLVSRPTRSLLFLRRPLLVLGCSKCSSA